MEVLAGDIGGTNARLAIVDGHRVTFVRHYPCREFTNFEQVLSRFLQDLGAPPPAYACLAMAGAVRDDRVRLTNLSWTVDGDRLASHFGFEAVHLANDFQAAAIGVTLLGEESLVPLGGAAPDPSGTKAVLGAGTGLGQAILVHCGAGYKVIPTEGGHGDFAPRNEEEIALLRYLLGRFEHVSVEHVLSGAGLMEIFRFLQTARELLVAESVTEAMAEEDPAAVITRYALEGVDPLCEATLAFFCRMYGAEAGNMALRSLTTGGVYIAGGIAPRIIPALQAGGFRKAFEAKGRMAPLLREIPVYVITHPQLGLLGAGVLATRLAQEANDEG